MIRINYETDFAVRITLKDASGTTMTPPTENAWWLHFTDSAGTCFKCGFDGTSYESCSISDDAIVCCIDNPGFVPGALTVTFRNDMVNASFDDGYENQVLPVSGELFLVQGASDDSGEIDMEMVISLIAPQITSATIDTAGDLNLVINYTTTSV